MIPDIKIKIAQLNPTNKVWPRSGWITKSEIINIVNNREKANFIVKLNNFSWEIIKLKVIIKNGLTNSIGCNLGRKNKDDVTIWKQLSKEKSKELYSEYKLLSRDRAKNNIDLTIPLEAEKFLSKIYKKMFGASICDRERKTIAGKKINCYSLNWEELYKHRDISAHKFEGIQRGKIDFTFGKESNLIDYNQPEYLKKLVMKEIKENKKLIINNEYFKKLKSPDVCAFLDD